MACHHFVFNPLVVQLNGMVSIVAPKLEKVLHNELFVFAPSDFKSCFLQLLSGLTTFYCLRIEQIENLFIINL